EGRALGADAVAGRDAAPREDELGRVRRVQAHLLLAPSRAEPGRPTCDAERRERALAGRREDHGEAREPAVGDELLRSADHVGVAAVQSRARCDGDAYVISGTKQFITNGGGGRPARAGEA